MNSEIAKSQYYLRQRVGEKQPLGNHTMNTSGETSLTQLVQAMQPSLADECFIFCTLAESIAIPLIPQTLGFFREVEGVTLILEKEVALAHQIQFHGEWAKITLRVHSSLEAVGFLATISQPLAVAGISTNVISAFYHDHLFVQWDRREKAVEILNHLAQTAAHL